MSSVLPPKPEPPKDYDCCGGGCADCELRLYLQRLAEWQKAGLDPCLQASPPDAARAGLAPGTRQL